MYTDIPSAMYHHYFGPVLVRMHKRGFAVIRCSPGCLCVIFKESVRKFSSNRRVENPFIGILKSSHQRERVIIFPFSCNPTRPPEFFAYLYITIPKRQKDAIYTPFPLSKVLTILISLMMEDESYRYDP